MPTGSRTAVLKGIEMNSKYSSLLVTILFFIFIQNLPPANAARILCLFPVPSKSHLVVFTALTKELASRGHELVVVSPFPLEKTPANYTDIDTMPSIKDYHENVLKVSVFNFAEMPVIQIPFVYWYHGMNLMSRTFSDQGLLSIIDDKSGFDLVICEDFMTEAFYGFADYFKAPMILISSLGGLHWTNYAVGNPLEQAYVPNPMLSYTDNMSLTERLINTVFTAFWDFGNFVFYIPQQEALRKQVFGDKTRSVWELRDSASLVLLNSHFSLNFPRPLSPAVIEVGGLHVKSSTGKLPQDLQSFLDGAKDGAIYFSMGSNLRSDEMPVEKLNSFLQAFSKLPQRVLWKWESDKLPGQPANVKLGKWLPQQEVLAHPNVRLFITHGGLLSTQEAVYHGIPLVGIPVFGDQQLNMNRAVQGGYALKVEIANVTEQSLLWAINKALNDPSIRLEASRRSEAFRDQPETPLERAVFWTEYVLRHNGAPHLRSAALKLTWFQRNLLDVAAVLLIIMITIVMVIWMMLRLLKKVCCSGKKQTSKTKLEHKKKK